MMYLMCKKKKTKKEKKSTVVLNQLWTINDVASNVKVDGVFVASFAP